jgi:hypothetical protein
MPVMTIDVQGPARMDPRRMQSAWVRDCQDAPQ